MQKKYATASNPQSVTFFVITTHFLILLSFLTSIGSIWLNMAQYGLILPKINKKFHFFNSQIIFCYFVLFRKWLYFVYLSDNFEPLLAQQGSI